ncbi:MAG: aspartyl-tRNA(Asn)/glutamyl-tRNA(Gln) amidotransferase subunit C [Motiliproteus sp.]|jgi:aspartyl-tRNA(Asn)/glutamyl-tRNA(Gln) amidotransferase subunit C
MTVCAHNRLTLATAVLFSKEQTPYKGIINALNAKQMLTVTCTTGLLSPTGAIIISPLTSSPLNQDPLMSLDSSDVQKIAHLARLQISATDIPEYAQNLSNILDLVDQMQAIETTGIEPLSNPLDAVQRLRADIATEGNLRDKLQTVAPAVEQGLFQVPKVID